MFITSHTSIEKKFFWSSHWTIHFEGFIQTSSLSKIKFRVLELRTFFTWGIILFTFLFYNFNLSLSSILSDFMPKTYFSVCSKTEHDSFHFILKIIHNQMMDRCYFRYSEWSNAIGCLDLYVGEISRLSSDELGKSSRFISLSLTSGAWKNDGIPVRYLSFLF